MCFIVLAVAFVVMGRSSLVNEKSDNMNETAKEIVQTAEIRYIEFGDIIMPDLDWRMSLSQISKITGYHIFVTDVQGYVINCSDSPYTCPHIGTKLSIESSTPPQVSAGVCRISDLGGFYKTKNYVTLMPVNVYDIRRVETYTVAYVFVAAEVSRLLDSWETFLAMFALTAALIMLVAVLMAYITSKQQSKPINEMASAALQFARGDFSVRVTEEPFRRDEIGALTAAFNAMANTLERSEQLRSEFIANISHELKTPMTTISGFADGILDGTIPPENQSRYLQTISDETKRLSRLLRSMLELSRIQSGAGLELLNREFDITETLRQSLITFEGKINERGLDVDIQIPENSIAVLGDEDSIMQVVYNLLDNAIKFSHRGSLLGISLWRQGNKAYVSVKNEGETIPPEEQALVFDRFHKTDYSRSLDRDGVGLGLYIVKTILNNHGEDIAVNSRDGITEFVFTLALKSQAGRHSQAQRQQPQAAEPEDL